MVSVEQESLLAERQPLIWLAQHGDALYAFAVRRVRYADLAEDLVQETLLAAIKAWDTFAQRSSLRTWLTSILRNKIADHFRQRFREGQPDVSRLEDDDMFDRRGHWKVPVRRWTGDPQQLAELAEFRSVLDGCVSKLPSRMAQLLTARFDEDASVSNVCDDLAITQANAWMLLHRARLRLRECLNRRWFKGAPDTPLAMGA